AARGTTANDHQALRLQDPERLPNGRSPQTALLDQLRLRRKRCARLDAPAEDQRHQLVSEAYRSLGDNTRVTEADDGAAGSLLVRSVLPSRSVRLRPQTGLFSHTCETFG